MFVTEICWERRYNTTAAFARITGGAGSTDPPNYYYLSHADSHATCQLACEQEAGCHAYSFYKAGYADVAYARMCYGVSESLVTTQEELKVNSGYKVNCGSQTSKILPT